MRLEYFSTFQAAAATYPDLTVPGLDASRFSSALLWFDGPDLALPENGTGGGKVGTPISRMVKQISAEWMTHASAAGWISSIGLFPAQQRDLVLAGWAASSTLAAFPPEHGTGLQFSARMPEPGSDGWDAFWNVPMNAPYVNALIGDVSVVAQLPDGVVNPLAEGLSTLLPWPWLADEVARREWLAKSQESIQLLILGAEECGLGLQCVVGIQRFEQLCLVLAGAVNTSQSHL